MRKIFTVAHNTFLEAIRDRVLLTLVVFILILICSSFVLGDISAEQHNKIVKDIGLSSISIIGVMISIFIGMGLVYKEIDKKTVYNIFSKPIYRYEFIIGKYMGLVFTLFIITLFMSLILFIFLYISTIGKISFIEFYYGGLHYPEFVKALYFQFLEFLTIIGLVLLFSSFTSPILTVLLTFLLFIIGRFSSDLKLFAQEGNNIISSLFAETLYRIIPNLEKFDVRAEAVYGGEISLSLIILTTFYSIIYSSILVLLSIIIFQRKQFK